MTVSVPVVVPWWATMWMATMAVPNGVGWMSGLGMRVEAVASVMRWVVSSMRVDHMTVSIVVMRWVVVVRGVSAMWMDVVTMAMIVVVAVPMPVAVVRSAALAVGNRKTGARIGGHLITDDN